MERLGREYEASKGKAWRFTSICETWASYKGRTGTFYYDSYVPCSWVDEYELVEEVDDPDFVVMPGFRAVYDTVCSDGKVHTFDTCNPVVYPFREMAEAAANEFNNHPWNKEDKAYVIDTVYEGKKPRETSTYEGRTVHNRDTFMYSYPVGTLVSEEVVDDAINALPPACMRSDCSQLGEPAGTRIDDNGNERFTYETFKRIAKGVWEYCGDCFRGENVQRGKEIVYV